MALPATPERQHTLPSSPEAAPSVVAQPVKIDAGQLGSFLESISGAISENAPTGPGEQGGGSAGGAMTQSAGGSTPVVSARDQAIANAPSPAIMQKQLEAHIKTEVKNLRKQAKMIARINQPGGAYRLNILYLRIHRLNALLSEMLSSSVEVVKKLFIRVFVDRQSIL